MNTGLKPSVNHTCEGCVSALAESGSGYAAAVNRLLKAVFARVTPPLRHRHIRNRIITIVTFTFITRGGKHEVEKKQYDENTTEYQLAKQQQSSKQHSGIFRFFCSETSGAGQHCSLASQRGFCLPRKHLQHIRRKRSELSL